MVNRPKLDYSILYDADALKAHFRNFVNNPDIGLTSEEIRIRAERRRNLAGFLIATGHEVKPEYAPYGENPADRRIEDND